MIYMISVMIQDRDEEQKEMEIYKQKKVASSNFSHQVSNKRFFPI